MAAKKSTPVDDGDRFKGLFYGPPGCGKTRLLGTAALDERTAPFAFIDFEGGRKTLKGLPGEGTDWVHIRVKDWSEYNDAFERVEINDEGFKSFGIDSLSEMHNYALLQILEDNAERRKNPDLVEQPDYGVALVQMRRVVKYAKDLPLHFFCTAHAKTDTDPREGNISIPNLYGKAAFEIPGLLETVGYLTESVAGEGDESYTYRTLLLQNYAKIRTKVRTSWDQVAPDEVDDPTITKLFDELGYEF